MEYVQPKTVSLENSETMKITGYSLLRGSRLYSIKSILIEVMPYSWMHNVSWQYFEVVSSTMIWFVTL